jgi:hypothetical protein
MALAGRLNRLRSDMDARILALRADTSDGGSIPRRPPGRAAPPDGSRRAGEAAQRTKAELQVARGASRHSGNSP